MKKNCFLKGTLKLTLLSLVCLLAFSSNKRAGLEISVISPMEKTFPDIFPSGTAPRVLSFKCAANEYEPAQFVIRSPKAIQGVTIALSELVSKDGHKLKDLHWNFVGFIPLDSNTPDTTRTDRCGSHDRVPEGEIIRLAPCKISDPLLEDEVVDLEANTTLPVWVTVHVPSGTPAGIYVGEARVKGQAIEDEVIPIELEVYPFELPKERNMYLTNWFMMEHISKAHNVELFSEKFWDILGKYAKNMAEHRQNVVYTPWSQLITVYRESGGSWSYDYANFDRFVQTFIDAGVDGRIEMTHIGTPSLLRHVEKGLYGVKVTDKKTGESVRVPGEEGLPLLLGSLQKHLEEKGWLEKAMLHVSDEPNYYTIDDWKKLARFTKKHAPGIRTIDAVSVPGFDGLLDVAVPLSLALEGEFELYKNEFQQGAGKELWFYICCIPYGHYPNRFLDYPLSDLRVLHWMNYLFDVSGYLHWGLTFGWEEHDGTNFGPAKRFPPGDSHLIYPGKEGPMNSIRWETQRESLEDFEYFTLLEAKTAAIKEKLGPAADPIPADFRSKEIGGKIVKAFSDHVEDIDAIYSVKELLASEIIEIDKEPLFLFMTTPNTNIPVKIGPAFIKLQGVVEEGSKVKVNGVEVEIRPDGGFVEIVQLEIDGQVVKIEVEKDGKKKTIEREFEVI